jgi:hypothetical protein
MKTCGGLDVQIHVRVFLTFALVRGGWSASRSASLSLGKEPPLAPIVQEAGWATEPVWPTWRREKSCPYLDSDSDPLAIQLIAGHYTDCAIPPPFELKYEEFNLCVVCCKSNYNFFTWACFTKWSIVPCLMVCVSVLLSDLMSVSKPLDRFIFLSSL